MKFYLTRALKLFAITVLGSLIGCLFLFLLYSEARGWALIMDGSSIIIGLLLSGLIWSAGGGLSMELLSGANAVLMVLTPLSPRLMLRWNLKRNAGLIAALPFVLAGPFLVLAMLPGYRPPYDHPLFNINLSLSMLCILMLPAIGAASSRPWLWEPFFCLRAIIKGLIVLLLFGPAKVLRSGALLFWGVLTATVYVYHAAMLETGYGLVGWLADSGLIGRFVLFLISPLHGIGLLHDPELPAACPWLLLAGLVGFIVNGVWSFWQNYPGCVERQVEAIRHAGLVPQAEEDDEEGEPSTEPDNARNGDYPLAPAFPITQPQGEIPYRSDLDFAAQVRRHNAAWSPALRLGGIPIYRAYQLLICAITLAVYLRMRQGGAMSEEGMEWLFLGYAGILFIEWYGTPAGLCRAFSCFAHMARVKGGAVGRMLFLRVPGSLLTDAALSLVLPLMTEIPWAWAGVLWLNLQLVRLGMALGLQLYCDYGAGRRLGFALYLSNLFSVPALVFGTCAIIQPDLAIATWIGIWTGWLALNVVGFGMARRLQRKRIDGQLAMSPRTARKMLEIT